MSTEQQQATAQEPCPFCGGAITTSSEIHLMGGTWKHARDCDTCRASGPPAATREAAIAAWDRRAYASPDLRAIAERNERYKAFKAAASRGLWVADLNGEEIFPADENGEGVIEEEIGAIISGPADQQFIVAARNMSPEADVDALLARVAELEQVATRAVDLFVEGGCKSQALFDSSIPPGQQLAAAVDEVSERWRRGREYLEAVKAARAVASQEAV